MSLAANMTKVPLLAFQAVEKTFRSESGARVAALTDVTFSITDGAFVSVIGPSGCGKSTLLRLAGGLLTPTSGSILRHGSARSPTPDQAIVFQQYNLFPWLTVEKNIAFGLLAKQIEPERRNAIVREYLDSMGLRAFAHLYPRELSGGMQQRVGLARALATNPRLLLMDEPFAAIDVLARQAMQDLLLRLFESEQRTVMFTTHDVGEAILLSDVICVLTARPGRIAHQVAVTLPRPRDRQVEFSAAFIALKRKLQALIAEGVSRPNAE